MKVKKERRKYKRIDLLIPAVFETNQKEVNLKKMDSSAGTIENISTGGALIKTSIFLPKGASLSLQINLDQASPSLTLPIIDKKGVIKTTSKLISFRKQVGNKYEMGIEFIKLDSKDKKIISQIVDRGLKKAIKSK